MKYKNLSENSEFEGLWVAGKCFDGTLTYKNGDIF
jgi:hypothetical protein